LPWKTWLSKRGSKPSLNTKPPLLYHAGMGVGVSFLLDPHAVYHNPQDTKTMSEQVSYIDYFTNYTDVSKSLFLGRKMGLIENLRNEFPKVWDLYKQLKSLDWDENEIDISSCRNEFKTLPPEVTNLMIRTLAWQYEADSSASHIGALMMPFVNNTELMCYFTELSKNECLTPDHEVLTINGWMGIAQVTRDTVLAQWDYEQNQIGFVRPTGIITKHHQGEMYHFHNREGTVDQLVTPKHRMPTINHSGSTSLEDRWKSAKDVQYSPNTALPYMDLKEVSRGKLNHINFATNVEKTLTHYNGPVHCLVVPSNYFIVKRNNAISVTGNCLHALAYKVIVQNSFDNPEVFLKELMSIKESFQRLDNVKEVFDEVYKLSHEYALGIQKDEQVIRKALFKFWVTLYCLERIQFMSSFAITFGLAEQSYFVPIAKLVQKICTDEFQIHVQGDKTVLTNELAIE
jgi:ribonucleotide reductase beta subunit family protein with ferritin-like domain